MDNQNNGIVISENTLIKAFEVYAQIETARAKQSEMLTKAAFDFFRDVKDTIKEVAIAQAGVQSLRWEAQKAEHEASAARHNAEHETSKARAEGRRAGANVAVGA